MCVVMMVYVVVMVLVAMRSVVVARLRLGASVHMLVRMLMRGVSRLRVGQVVRTILSLPVAFSTLSLRHDVAHALAVARVHITVDTF